MKTTPVFLRRKRSASSFRMMLYTAIIFFTALSIYSFGYEPELVIASVVLILLCLALLSIHAKVFYLYPKNELQTKWNFLGIDHNIREQYPEPLYVAIVSVFETQTSELEAASWETTSKKFNVNLIFPKGAPLRYKTICTTNHREALKVAKAIAHAADKKIYLSAGRERVWLEND